MIERYAPLSARPLCQARCAEISLVGQWPGVNSPTVRQWLDQIDVQTLHFEPAKPWDKD